MKVTKPTNAKERIILALDVDTIEEVKELVTELKDYVGYFKVGLPLLSSCGMHTFDTIKQLGAKAYCDIKFNDIPHTIAKACTNLMKNHVDFFNVHIQGGSKMITAAVKTSKETAKQLNTDTPTILGITLLSSFGQRTLTEELCIEKNIEEYILKLAQVAKDCGLDGVVAGAAEARKIRQQIGEDFIILCPATRPTWAAVNDQVRVDTPTEAIKAGVDYLVIGRPITDAVDRVAATKLIIDEINTALQEDDPIDD